MKVEILSSSAEKRPLRDGEMAVVFVGGRDALRWRYSGRVFAVLASGEISAVGIGGIVYEDVRPVRSIKVEV